MKSEQELSERRFEVYEALYWYSSNYHTGWNSRAYRLLSIVSRSYKPGLTALQYSDLTWNGVLLVNRLIQRNY